MDEIIKQIEQQRINIQNSISSLDAANSKLVLLLRDLREAKSK